MFDEAWRIQRDYFYVKNMQGSDWNRVKEQYGALVPFVAHRADLSYLLDEMQSELAVGHSFVNGGDMPPVPTSTTGMLGADFAVADGRYRITKIYTGESWNPDLRAPLAAPGVDVHEGDYVLAVNGVELRAPDDLFRLLDGTATRQTVITVNAKPVDAGARNVTVIPVSTERGTPRSGVDRAQSARRRFAFARAARVRLSAQHGECAATAISIATSSLSRTERE